MKIIFLDIDGVLNYQGSHLIDENCLDNLKLIVSKTDAKIVLISTWKQFLDDSILVTLSEEQKKDFLYYRYLMGEIFKDTLEIFDITEDYFADKEKEIIPEISLSELSKMDTDDHSAWRSVEISRWLDKNKDKNIESFVILDDFNCKYDKYYPNYWVATWWFGKALRKEDAEKAIKILNGEV